MASNVGRHFGAEEKERDYRHDDKEMGILPVYNTLAAAPPAGLHRRPSVKPGPAIVVVRELDPDTNSIISDLDHRPAKVFGFSQTFKKSRIIVAIMFGLGLASLLAVSVYIEFTAAASTSLPAYPLAVKSPYLSAWLSSADALDVPAAQPQFWTGSNNPLTWSIVARVNGQVYSVFGAPNVAGATAATQHSISYTSSHTYVTLTAGQANVTLDFFSPVLPETADLARQSLPYSYLTVNATSLVAPAQNAATVDVQILSAIDSSWTAQGTTPQLNYTQTENSSYFEYYNPNAIPFTEHDDMATYGSVVFATANTAQTTYGCNTPAGQFAKFTQDGQLGGLTSYTGGPSCTGSQQAGLAYNIGSLAPGNTGSATFAVGFERVQAINYLNTTQTGYYRSVWPTISEQVDFFLGDYNNASSQSHSLDAFVRSKATSVSSSWGSAYADILEASVRQAFAASEITIPLSNLSTANPFLFLKEISSDGNVNTIDVIFPTFPIYLIFNPEYLKMVLEPVLRYLNYPVSAGGWPKNFAIHDIGSAYPNATGHANGVEEDMPLFESSALLQLVYAYQIYGNDTAWAGNYTSVLTEYATYLQYNGLIPASQLISVDAIQATANQTGLAVQSAIGLKAAGALLKNSAFTNSAEFIVNEVYNQGLGLDGSSPSTSTHFTYNYGLDSTWGTLFPAYPDVLLNLTTFPTAAYTMEGNFLLSQNQPAGLPFFGPYSYTVPLTAGCDWTITDWTFWTSAAIDNEELQGAVVNATHAFLTNGMNTEPFGTKYVVEQPGTIGQWIGNRARSTVGANFALILLEQGTWGKLY